MARGLSRGSISAPCVSLGWFTLFDLYFHLQLLSTQPNKLNKIVVMVNKWPGTQISSGVGCLVERVMALNHWLLSPKASANNAN